MPNWQRQRIIARKRVIDLKQRQNIADLLDVWAKMEFRYIILTLILLLLTEYFSANYDVNFGTQSFQIPFHFVRAPSRLRAFSVSDLALADRATIKNSKWPPHYTKVV